MAAQRLLGVSVLLLVCIGVASVAAGEISALKSDYPIEIIDMIEHKGNILVFVGYRDLLAFHGVDQVCERDQSNATAILMVKLNDNYKETKICLDGHNISGVASRGNELMAVRTQGGVNEFRTSIRPDVCTITIPENNDSDLGEVDKEGPVNCNINLEMRGRLDEGITVLDDTTYVALRSGNRAEQETFTLQLFEIDKSNKIVKNVTVLKALSITDMRVTNMAISPTNTSIVIILEVYAKMGASLVNPRNSSDPYRKVTHNVENDLNYFKLVIPLSNLEGRPTVTPTNPPGLPSITYGEKLYALTQNQVQQYGFTSYYVSLHEFDLRPFNIPDDDDSEPPSNPPPPPPPPRPPSRPTPPPPPPPPPPPNQDPGRTPAVNNIPDDEDIPTATPEETNVIIPRAPSPDDSNYNSWAILALVFLVLCGVGYLGWRFLYSNEGRQFVQSSIGNRFPAVADWFNARLGGGATYERVDPNSVDAEAGTSTTTVSSSGTPPSGAPRDFYK